MSEEPEIVQVDYQNIPSEFKTNRYLQAPAPRVYRSFEDLKDELERLRALQKD